MTTITEITSLSLPDTKRIVEATYEQADKVMDEVESDMDEVRGQSNHSAQFLTGKVTRWQYLKAHLLRRKAKLDRLSYAAKQDFNEKYWGKLRHGPRGVQQANGFAFEERKAAAMSEFIVEHQRWELLMEAADDIERTIRALDAHLWGVKNLQAVVRMEHDDAKYSTNKDYID